jgi:CheY-like chemotaxis protein
MVKKILLIEDEEIIRFNLMNFLQNNGFYTLSSGDGLTGLQIAREAIPDLIISNVGLPRLNGYEVLKELRSNPATASIPFILLTAQAPQPELLQKLQIELHQFLMKPYTPNELLQTIYRVIQSESS